MQLSEPVSAASGEIRMPPPADVTVAAAAAAADAAAIRDSDSIARCVSAARGAL